MTPVVQTVASTTDHAWEYGVIGFLCLVFAGVIVFLYKRIEAIRDAHDIANKLAAKLGEEDRASWADERKAWDIERTKWGIEREKIRADLSEKFARDLREVTDDSRAHEGAIRKEYADMLETMSNEAKRASDALVAMLQKFHDRALSKGSR